MLYIRSFIFTVWFISFCIFLCLFGVFFLPFPKKYTVKYVQWWSKAVIKWTNILAGIKLDIKGLENLPKDGPYIVACKHQSAFDTVIFHSFIPNASFLFKYEMSKVPFMSQLLKKMDCIPVNRKHGALVLRKIVSSATACLKQGNVIIIFPEGTRTAPKEHIRYSHGVSMIYSVAKVPVVPAAINSGYVWPKNSFIKKSGRVTLQLLPPIPVGMDKKEMMTQLEKNIEDACKQLPDVFINNKKNC